MASILPMLTEPDQAYCLNIAKLNLYECLSVSKPYYEDIFCLGQHAMIDPGQCVVDATKAPAARQVAMTKVSDRR